MQIWSSILHFREKKYTEMSYFIKSMRMKNWFLKVIYWITISFIFSSVALVEIHANTEGPASAAMDEAIKAAPQSSPDQKAAFAIQQITRAASIDAQTESTMNRFMVNNPGATQWQIDTARANATQKATAMVDGTAPTEVYVTEKIPWAECTCVNDTNTVKKDDEGNDYQANYNCGDPKTRKYVCKVGKWLTSFQNIFREIVRWVVYVVMLLGVLAIAGAGILWAWGSDSEEYTKKAKWWVMNIVIGLFILFTFRYILGFLAPWIFR